MRGSDKTPGEFRTSQNWIGGQGSSLKNARYIPPSVDDMKIALNQLEQFMNSDNRLSEVRRSGNYEQWIFFFLQMILEPSAKRGKASLYSYTDYLAILRRGTEL